MYMALTTPGLRTVVCAWNRQKYVINPVIKAVVAKYWGGGVLSPSRMSNRLFQSCFCWLRRKDSNQKENGDNGWMVSAGQVGRIGLLQEGFPVLLRPVLGSDETTNSGKAGILREAEQLIPELLKAAGLGEALDQVNLRSLVGMGPEVLETMVIALIIVTYLVTITLSSSACEGGFLAIDCADSRVYLSYIPTYSSVLSICIVLVL